ncbi:hypothetical protein [Phormidium nigroviride]
MAIAIAHIHYSVEGRRKKEEGRRKKEEGRRKKEEGRRKKEEGRRKKVYTVSFLAIPILCLIRWLYLFPKFFFFDPYPPFA